MCSLTRTWSTPPPGGILFTPPCRFQKEQVNMQCYLVTTFRILDLEPLVHRSSEALVWGIHCPHSLGLEPLRRCSWKCRGLGACLNNYRAFVWILITQLREVFKKSKWKFKMAFAIRRPTPPLMAKFPAIFSPHFFSFATESYIYETDFTLQKYHF